MAQVYKLSLQPVQSGQAQDDAENVLEKAKAQVGFIPNMYANMANEPALLDAYLDGYEHFRYNTAFNSIEQEVVFLTISRENGCHYCMAAHSMLADKQSGVPADITRAIRDYDNVPDEKLAELVRFTAIMTESRGRPSPDDARRFLQAGYSERHILDIILAQAVKTLSNYSNHLFHTQVDDMFSHYSWEEKSSSAA